MAKEVHVELTDVQESLRDLYESNFSKLTLLIHRHYNGLFFNVLVNMPLYDKPCRVTQYVSESKNDDPCLNDISYSLLATDFDDEQFLLDGAYKVFPETYLETIVNRVVSKLDKS